MILNKGIYVFHGSYAKVEKPDLRLCMAGKDFGLGFYVTTDIQQARRFVNLSIGKAVKNGVEVEKSNLGYVSTYELMDLDSILSYEFSSADREWLHCVVAHRREGLLPHETDKWNDYEIIAGKIANDNTNRVITGYINGLYGEAGSDSADNIAISLLIPEKLTDQVCFRTEKALDKLRFIKAEVVFI